MNIPMMIAGYYDSDIFKLTKVPSERKIVRCVHLKKVECITWTDKDPTILCANTSVSEIYLQEIGWFGTRTRIGQCPECGQIYYAIIA